jgi:hypothetical protein
MSDINTAEKRLALVLVEPQPTYIESSGRWSWPLKPPHDNNGRCPSVVTASREWWEYAPSGAKPHPWAEGVRLRDDKWYWAIPLPFTVELHRGWAFINDEIYVRADKQPAESTHEQAGVFTNGDPR